MRIGVDLTKEESGFEAIPAGNYEVKVVEAQEKTSKAGHKKIALVFEVTGAESAGRKLFHDLSELPQALWKLKKFLDACGVEYDEDGFATEDILGSDLEVVVVQEIYNEKPTNKVTDYLSLK